jgi:hypothetical protein
LAISLAWMACGMRSAMMLPAEDDAGSSGEPTGTGGRAFAGSGGHSASGGSSAANGGAVSGKGGSSTGGLTSTVGASGGNTTIPRGGSGGAATGGSGTGGKVSTGGTTSVLRDASAPGDTRVAADARPIGTPTVDPNSGYTTIATGTVVMSGYVASSVAGSGSSIGLTYTETSFCAAGTVAASTTYNSWANAGFSVNQAQSGSSGSTSSLPLVGSTLSITYVNHAGSTLELQLWDGSNYWCYYLPPATSPATTVVPFSSLNTRCWDNTGTAFASGTAITNVQLVVPGSATKATPFDYCFLGLAVK